MSELIPESAWVEPSQKLASLIEEEHNSIEGSQKSPWLNEAEQRYVGKVLPDGPRGSENGEAWDHIRRHVAFLTGTLQLSMIPGHMRQKLAGEVPVRPIPRPRGFIPPPGATKITLRDRLLYRVRIQINNRMASLYVDQRGRRLYYSRVVHVQRHVRIMGRNRLRVWVKPYRVVRFYHVSGEAIRNPLKRRT